MREGKHWADPFEGPEPEYVPRDKRSIRQVVAGWLVFWIAVGSAVALVVLK